MENTKKKTKFDMPHSLVIIFIMMILAAILTYIIPAGEYERITLESGQTIVDPATFHYIESSPVNPLWVIGLVFEGLNKAKSVIFVLLCAGGGMGIILKTGMFQSVATTIGKKARGKEWVVISLVTTLFALLCIPVNLNFFIPFAPMGVLIASSLGLDAIVGISIIMLGGAVGFSCGAMNISNTGTAQIIAELPMFSGMGYRLICMIPFLIVTIIYILRYANKCKVDEKNGLLYGVELENKIEMKEDIEPLQKKHIPMIVVFLAGLSIMTYLAVQRELTNELTATIFMYMGLACGIASRMKVKDICNSFIDGVKGMASTSIMIGFAYVISVILTKGNVMDTVVYALSNLLGVFPKILQAPVMLIMHIIINFFVTSGSGQAAVTMPIFVPVADIVGVSRQTAVLAFNFGDGFCNNVLPHAAATMGFIGIAGIPFSRWFKYVIKLFLIWTLVGCILLMIAQSIGY
ncbi:YfcC family protein [Kallipyga massiliensis]|uniref:YfcC family protein n=1 Tax=Kallipyga massiliensis TaxID=1472764 RepID=UPI0004B48059|nr:AbgT family transporter [Kallipyga massiliensis]